MFNSVELPTGGLQNSGAGILGFLGLMATCFALGFIPKKDKARQTQLASPPKPHRSHASRSNGRLTDTFAKKNAHHRKLQTRPRLYSVAGAIVRHATARPPGGSVDSRA